MIALASLMQDFSTLGKSKHKHPRPKEKTTCGSHIGDVVVQTGKHRDVDLLDIKDH